MFPSDNINSSLKKHMIQCGVTCKRFLFLENFKVEPIL